MPAAHRELYYIATGRRVQHPLAIEIPYAVGIGAGVLLFFSLPTGSGAEPGPLELEMDRHRDLLRGYWRERGRRRS
jgi:stage V sporulation protein AA